jgi:hypothetical protein
MEKAEFKTRTFRRRACYLAIGLYLPFFVVFRLMSPPRDWTTLPVAPGWFIWFVFDPGRNRLAGLLSAGVVTVCLYLALLRLTAKSSGRAMSILAALLASVPSALILWVFARIAGH